MNTTFEITNERLDAANQIAPHLVSSDEPQVKIPDLPFDLFLSKTSEGLTVLKRLIYKKKTTLFIGMKK